MKTPRYFCEHCGAEVKGSARICPHCGRFFSSVKCPRCGTVGRAEDFRAGCPVCGYADAMNAPPEPIKPLPPADPPLPLWTWVTGLLVFVVIVWLFLRALH